MSIPKIGLILALLLSLGVGTVVSASATGSASPTQAVPGTRIHFTASGWTPGERIDLWASPPIGPTRPRYPSVVADVDGAAV